MSHQRQIKEFLQHQLETTSLSLLEEIQRLYPNVKSLEIAVIMSAVVLEIGMELLTVSLGDIANARKFTNTILERKFNSMANHPGILKALRGE